jgi:hypothetical protein
VTGPNPKFDCARCEDFGTVVGADGRGTASCPEPGCPQAARLRAKAQPQASATPESSP